MLQKNILLIFVGTTLFALVAAKCPPGSVNRNEKCYKFHSELSPYKTANLSCSILKGHLAVPLNQEDNDFLQQESKQHFKNLNPNDAWIGAKLPLNGSYANYEEHALEFAIFNGVSLQTFNGKWKLAAAYEKDIRKPYICEYEKPVNTIAPPTLKNLTTTIATTVISSSTNGLTTPTTATTSKITKQPLNTPKGNCTDDWSHFDGHCYKSTTPEKFNWKNAEAYCATQNAHLVSFHNKAELMFVDNEFDKQNNCYWNGLLSIDKIYKNYTYTDGTPFDFVTLLSVAPRKPGDLPYAPCIYSCNHQFWNANRCDGEKFAVCKKSAIF